MARIPRFLIGILAILSATNCQGQQVGGALLLKDGDRVLQGQVTQLGDQYEVRLAEESRVIVAASKVRFVGEDLEALYQYKVQSIKRWEPGDHFQLTRWCVIHGLVDHAVDHYAQVSERYRDHPRVKQLARELKEKLLEQPDFRAYLGLAPNVSTEPTVRLAAAQPLPGNTTAAVVTARADWMESAQHPEIGSRFSQRIQPILMNRCSQAACHGFRSTSELKLVEPYARQHAKITADNMRSALEQVSKDGDQVSPLLRYATTAHAIQRLPAIAVTETDLLREIGDWIRLVQNPVVTAEAEVPAGTAGTEAARLAGHGSTTGLGPGEMQAPFVPYTPGVKLVPVKPGASGLRRVPQDQLDGNGFPIGERPTQSEIDELDLIIRRLVDEYAIGVILIEHRLELLSAVADACVVLDLGEVIAKGRPRDVFDDPRVKAAYFEGADA